MRYEMYRYVFGKIYDTYDDLKKKYVRRLI